VRGAGRHHGPAPLGVFTAGLNQPARLTAADRRQHFEVPDKAICNVRVFADGWASIEFPSLSSYRLNALAVRPEVWACVMQVMRSKACSDIHEFLCRHGLRERA
jgi:hypothetical protein